MMGRSWKYKMDGVAIGRIANSMKLGFVRNLWDHPRKLMVDHPFPD